MKVYISNVMPLLTLTALVSNYHVLTVLILFAFLKPAQIHCLEKIRMTVWYSRIFIKSSQKNPVLLLKFFINETKANILNQNKIQLWQ